MMRAASSQAQLPVLVTGPTHLTWLVAHEEHPNVRKTVTTGCHSAANDASRRFGGP